MRIRTDSCRAVLAAALLAGAVPLAAQIPSLGSLKEFKWADLYETSRAQPGQTNRLKTLITGAEALPKPGGLVQVLEARIESYDLDGRTNLITQAPTCMVNKAAREVSSTGPLEIQTGDGLFTTAGRGFLCRLTHLSLFISNDVQTVIRQLPGKPVAGSALSAMTRAGGVATNPSTRIAAPITIRSAQLEFDRVTNRVQYTGSVEVDNAQFRLQSQSLDLQLTPHDTLEEIVAEGEVRLTGKEDSMRAQGDRAVYTADPAREGLQLSGNARWTDGARSGEAELMTFDPAKNVLVAQQQAMLRFPRGVVRQFAAGASTNAVAAPAPATNAAGSNQWVEVRADLLRIQLPTTNQPHRSITARTNVVVLSPADQSRATGDEATYNEATGELALTGHAVWQDDRRLMKARSLAYDRVRNRFRAHQETYLRLPVTALGKPQSLQASPGDAAAPVTLTNHFLEVTCQDLDYQDAWLTLEHQVHGRLLAGTVLLGTLDCDTARLRFQSNQLERVELDRRVHIQQLPLDATPQARVARSLKGERLEADLSPGGYVREVVIRTNVIARQEEWSNGRPTPIASTLAADRFTAQFFPNTNAVSYAEAEGHVEARHDDKAARGERTVYWATNDLLVLQGAAELDLGIGGVIRSPRFQLRPFQRWLREGQVGPFGLPVLPPSSNAPAGAGPQATGSPAPPA